MKAEPPSGAQGPSNRKKQKPKGAKQPRRGQTSGPIGFGSVLRNVRGDDALLSKPIDAGTQAARAMGAVPTAGTLANDASFGVKDAVETVAANDRSSTHAAKQEAPLPSALGRMTPSAALNVVIDEATKLDIAQAAKELHIELEPVHLGPLIVRLRREPDGRLDVRFRARQADAARILDAGADLLRERLTDAGFAGSNVLVEQDAALVITPQG